jgi:hypothetical protein
LAVVGFEIGDRRSPPVFLVKENPGVKALLAYCKLFSKATDSEIIDIYLQDFEAFGIMFKHFSIKIIIFNIYILFEN